MIEYQVLRQPARFYVPVLLWGGGETIYVPLFPLHTSRIEIVTENGRITTRVARVKKNTTTLYTVGGLLSNRMSEMYIRIMNSLY